MAIQNAEAIQKLYVAYFNRPADYYGLQYWDAIVTAAGGDTSAVAAAFAGSQEYKDTYAGMDLRNTINAIYKNLFGHSADLPGLDFWTNAVNTGAMTLSNAVEQIASGAQNADKTAYASKVSAATTFTNSLTNTDQILGYSGDKANAVAKGFLAGVTDANSLATAIDPANLSVTIGTVIGQNLPVGDTKTLTVGIDNVVGTNNNDVFNAYASGVTADGKTATTLSANDVIDGGAGIDTLNIEVVSSADGKFNTSQVGTVRNVEIINIDNTAAKDGLFGNADGMVDAAKFIGATNINQVSAAAGVMNLAASTTATFTNVTKATGDAALSVSALAAASSAKIALSGVTGAAATNVATLNVSGDALSSVTVSGSIAKEDTKSSTAASLALNIVAGTDSKGASVSKVSVNTAVKTTLSVTEAEDATGNVTSVDASASSGAITYVAKDTVSTIATGAGKDTVTVSYKTVAAAGSTAAKNASVSTGAGDDTINVLTTGTGLTTVDAGAGNDKINVTKVAGAGLNIMGGEGNDTVTLTGAALATSDVIDGGAGTDTIQLAGAGERTADDYIVFNKLLKNFETIKFTGTEGALDASQLASTYATIDLGNASVVTKVGAQTIVANGDLTATANGYSVSGSGAITYGGTLNLTSKADGTITANADVVKLTVAAGTADATATLAGHAKSAIVTLTNGADADGETTVAKLSLTNSATVNKDLASVTLSGNGSAVITNVDGTKLVSVDASALASANSDGKIDGLTYTSSNTAVETVKLGAGIDHVTLNAGASTYGNVDTITGLSLVLATGGKTLAATSDTLHIDGVTAAAKFTTTQTDFDLALKDAAAATLADGVDSLVFSFGGDTYVFHDAGTVGSVDAADVVVKLTGAVNLDALVIALGHTPEQ
ncbi:DUF4214 domain-containing protein [uncultured Massilia sp.]|uniref:DUF4214 domain-containing protein n=1 Tax=uncultured Massilia sp. TaxID=169973 RepID=UPI0025F97045|nr:DUF4214 domain-containing protein [uncultured Massilia sp.]